jgi:phosphatidylinositol 4-kinase A
MRSLAQRVHQVISKHRALLNKLIPLRHGDVRYLSNAQIIFVLSMHDIESMRSAAGRPSSLVSYFVNDSLNRHQSLNNCMDSVAENVCNTPKCIYCRSNVPLGHSSVHQRPQ